MLNSKYKVSQASKDLEMKSKDVIAVLEKYGRVKKSSSASLDPEEFSILLNDLSLENQVVNIADYLDKIVVIPRKLPKPEKKPAVEEKPADGDKTETGKTEKTEGRTAPAAKPGADGKDGKDGKKEAKPAKDAKAGKEVKGGGKPEKAAKQPAKQKDQKKPAQARKHMERIEMKTTVRDEKTSLQPIDSDTRRDTRSGSVRVVDTRSGNVDLSKYNEKFDNMAPDQDRGFRGGTRKQKNRPQKGDKGGSKRERERREREERMKNRQEMMNKQVLHVAIPDEITVGELASRLKLKTPELIKKLMMLGVMAGVNDVVDYDTAYLVADEMGAKITHEVAVKIEDTLFETDEDEEKDLVPRPPVICVMGHVDHGKTSLLDTIRHSNVTAGEAGGITQHIGAYTVNVNGKEITFLDTPGHEAFTAMRARGAMATDIAILVVAANDGIMPQTVEAINHAKAAGVDIIVAINKMDLPGANPEGVKQEMTKYDLVPEEWGGDVICVPVSAVKKTGIDDLLENVLLIAEVKDYKANPDRRAKGLVIEAKLDKGRGPVATVLVQNGTLHTGDTVIAGTAVGRVRAMTNDKGKVVKSAGPSMPVEIIGLSEVPQAGDEFNAVEDEKMARTLAEQRRAKAKENESKANARVSLDDLFAQMSDGVQDLNIIVKADVQGSAEAVKQSLEKLTNDEIKVKVIHAGVGGIIENDVTLASASNAIIVGFNVRPDKQALAAASKYNVDIRTYRVIYECIEEITAAMKGMLAPEFKEELLGHAEVRQTIRVPNVGTIAGSYVQDGKIMRNAQIRVVRDGIVIFEDKISSLKRFKDDVREVAQGYECGIGLERFNDIKEGDILEAFHMVEVKR